MGLAGQTSIAGTPQENDLYTCPDQNDQPSQVPTKPRSIHCVVFFLALTLAWNCVVAVEVVCMCTAPALY